MLIERHYLRGERFDHVAASLNLSKSWASRLHTRAIGLLTRRLKVLAR
jgi:RNA polymerase sigma factor for flagellar operon FliA